MILCTSAISLRSRFGATGGAATPYCPYTILRSRSVEERFFYNNQHMKKLGHLCLSAPNGRVNEKHVIKMRIFAFPPILTLSKDLNMANFHQMFTPRSLQVQVQNIFEFPPNSLFFGLQSFLQRKFDVE